MRNSLIQRVFYTPAPNLTVNVTSFTRPERVRGGVSLGSTFSYEIYPVVVCAESLANPVAAGIVDAVSSP